MKKFKPFILSTLVLLIHLTALHSNAEDGYRLWLRYDLISDIKKLKEYQSVITDIIFNGHSPVLLAAKEELSYGLSGLLGREVQFTNELVRDGTVILGTPENSDLTASLDLKDKLKDIGEEGYIIRNISVANNECIAIIANKDIGILYGVFHFLRLLQTHADISHLSISSAPEIKVRLLNHWDNLNRTVERGYAGLSLWEWSRLPDNVSPRYKDYARANASIGINGTVLTNVNANAQILTGEYLEKVAVLDGCFSKNVLIQVKNGPIDFQPREPFHPLFGAMPKTPLMMEFQVTQEYLGHSKHLVYLAPLFKECLASDTYARGPGPWVSRGRADWTSVYYHRVDSVRWMQKTWNSLEGKIDRERFLHVKEKLKIQEENAVFWRNACLLYFQTFSKRPIPEEYENPDMNQITLNFSNLLNLLAV